MAITGELDHLDTIQPPVHRHGIRPILHLQVHARPVHAGTGKRLLRLAGQTHTYIKCHPPPKKIMTLRHSPEAFLRARASNVLPSSTKASSITGSSSRLASKGMPGTNALARPVPKAVATPRAIREFMSG